MTLIRLDTIRVEKPWGRMRLWPGFAAPVSGEAPIGEIWFDSPDAAHLPLMIKYLFTSERLSIQVHPNDEQARASGFLSGKDEAWIILDAEPGSTIALGTVRPLSHEQLRAAALDGSIETLMDWKPVRAGDVIYSAAGTVHAIGAGLTLIEVQQNLDLTYRLYDYGRPRELHLDAGIAVSHAAPITLPPTPPVTTGRTTIIDSDKFVIERWIDVSGTFAAPHAQPAWLIAVSGSGIVGDTRWHAGECWLLEGEASIGCHPGSTLLIAYAR